jgi:hypothetical protein
MAGQVVGHWSHRQPQGYRRAVVAPHNPHVPACIRCHSPSGIAPITFAAIHAAIRSRSPVCRAHISRHTRSRVVSAVVTARLYFPLRPGPPGVLGPATIGPPADPAPLPPLVPVTLPPGRLTAARHCARTLRAPPARPALPLAMT